MLPKLGSAQSPCCRPIAAQLAMRESTDLKRLETRITELEQLLKARETDLARVSSDAKYARIGRSAATAVYWSERREGHR